MLNLKWENENTGFFTLEELFTFWEATQYQLWFNNEFQCCVSEWRPYQLQYLPMSRGGDEVEAAVHSVVRHLSSIDPGLWVEVILKLTVDVINDWLPAIGEKSTDITQCQVTVTTFNVEYTHSDRDIGQVSQSDVPVTVVDSVAEPWRVNDGEKKLNSSFLYQHLRLLHLRL